MGGNTEHEIAVNTAKYSGDNQAYQEWSDHLPLSLVDLIGIKTYDSILPDNVKPHYVFYGEYTMSDFLHDLG